MTSLDRNWLEIELASIEIESITWPQWMHACLGNIRTQIKKEKQMLPHQERVVAEGKELSDKFIALGLYIGSEEFKTLDQIDQDLLRQQFDTMREYRNILASRITRFTPKNRRV